MKFCKDRQQRKQEEYIITHEEYMYEGISLLKNNDVISYTFVEVVVGGARVALNVILCKNMYAHI